MDNDTISMHNILSKLQGVNKTTQIVAERAEHDVDLQVAITQKVTENSITVQNYKIDIVLQKFGNKQKRFYNICEDNNIIHREVALFETAMGVVKNLILNKHQKVTELLDADLEYNNALYEVYMYKMKLKKSLNEDVIIAKLSQAQKKLGEAKAKILRRL